MGGGGSGGGRTRGEEGRGRRACFASGLGGGGVLVLVPFGYGLADAHADLEEGGLHFGREGGAQETGRGDSVGCFMLVGRGEEIVVDVGSEVAALGDVESRGRHCGG